MNDKTCKLDARLLCQLATDVLQALQFISNCGIQHNNVNMKNILIRKTEEEVTNDISIYDRIHQIHCLRHSW